MSANPNALIDKNLDEINNVFRMEGDQKFSNYLDLEKLTFNPDKERTKDLTLQNINDRPLYLDTEVSFHLNASGKLIYKGDKRVVHFRRINIAKQFDVLYPAFVTKRFVRTIRFMIPRDFDVLKLNKIATDHFFRIMPFLRRESIEVDTSAVPIFKDFTEKGDVEYGTEYIKPVTFRAIPNSLLYYDELTINFAIKRGDVTTTVPVTPDDPDDGHYDTSTPPKTPHNTTANLSNFEYYDIDVSDTPYPDLEERVEEDEYGVKWYVHDVDKQNGIAYKRDQYTRTRNRDDFPTKKVRGEDRTRGNRPPGITGDIFGRASKYALVGGPWYVYSSPGCSYNVIPYEHSHQPKGPTQGFDSASAAYGALKSWIAQCVSEAKSEDDGLINVEIDPLPSTTKEDSYNPWSNTENDTVRLLGFEDFTTFSGGGTGSQGRKRIVNPVVGRYESLDGDSGYNVFCTLHINFDEWVTRREWDNDSQSYKTNKRNRRYSYYIRRNVYFNAGSYYWDCPWIWANATESGDITGNLSTSVGSVLGKLGTEDPYMEYVWYMQEGVFFYELLNNSTRVNPERGWVPSWEFTRDH